MPGRASSARRPVCGSIAGGADVADGQVVVDAHVAFDEPGHLPLVRMRDRSARGRGCRRGWRRRRSSRGGPADRDAPVSCVIASLCRALASPGFGRAHAVARRRPSSTACPAAQRSCRARGPRQALAQISSRVEARALACSHLSEHQLAHLLACEAVGLERVAPLVQRELVQLRQASADRPPGRGQAAVDAGFSELVADGRNHGSAITSCARRRVGSGGRTAAVAVIFA